jgi:hypothetical protein
VEHDRKETETDIVTCAERDLVRDMAIFFFFENKYLTHRNDDYVWMAKDGTLTLYGNYHNPPYWLQYGTIYTPGELMVGHTRKDLFLADRESSLCDRFVIATNAD